MKKKYFLLANFALVILLVSCDKSSKEEMKVKPKQSTGIAADKVANELPKNLRLYFNLTYESILDNKPDQSILYADDFIAEAKKQGNKSAEALSYYMKGYIYGMQKEQYDKALYWLFESLVIRKELKEWEEVGKCYLGMADAYYSLQFSDKAILYYDLLLENTKQSGDKANEAAAYRGLGLTYDRLKQDYVTAALYFTRSLEIQKELKNDEKIAEAYHSLAGTYYMRKDLNQASTHYLKALEYRIKTENQSLANTYFDLGLVSMDLKNYTSAKLYFNKSLEVSERVSYSTLIVRSHMEFGIIAQLQKNYPTAIQELTIAQQLAEQDKNTHLNLLIDITDMFSKLYEEMGDDGKAMDYVHKKEAWQSTAAAERERITKLLENQRFDTVKWEDTVEQGKEDKGFSIWWYILSAVVLGFVAGVKGRKIYTGIQNALSIIPKTKKNKRNLSTQLRELKELVSHVLDKSQLHYSDQIKQEAQAIYAKMQEIEAHQHHISKRGISKRKLKELWDMLQNSKALLALANQQKTNSTGQS